ncbi:MAG: hypothetical protein WAR79_15150 [Melioribacteraceae bacterium]
MPNGLQITYNNIITAHQIFLENVPKDLFYKMATYLTKLSLEENSPFSLAEAISVLLQTWNKSFYRFRKFDLDYFNKIEELIQHNFNIINDFRNREISSFTPNDNEVIAKIFKTFEKILGPVGSAKALHLLAPYFFPIWDRTIAIAYGQALSNRGINNLKYIEFMRLQKEQCSNLPQNLPDGISKLKAIDEYNYCHYSKGWM